MTTAEDTHAGLDLLDRMGVPALLWPGSGRECLANRAVCDLLGLQPQDLAVRDWWRRRLPSLALALWDSLLESAGRGVPVRQEVQVRHADGTWLRLELLGDAMVSGAGVLFRLHDLTPAYDRTLLLHVQHDFGLALVVCHTQQSLCEALFAGLRQIADVDTCALHECGGEHSRLFASYGFGDGFAAAAAAHSCAALAGDGDDRGEMAMHCQLPTHHDGRLGLLAREPWASEGLQALATVPVRFEGRLLGLLSIGSRHVGGWSGIVLAGLQTLAQQLAHALVRIEHEQQSRRDEALLRTILDSTADGILAIGPDGSVVGVNRRFQSLWQVPDALMRTKIDVRLHDFLGDQLTDPDAFLLEVRRLHGSDEENWSVLRLRDGRVYEWFTRPLRLREGLGRLWSYRDITASTRTLHQLQMIMESAGDAIWINAADGRYVYANPAACAMTGYPLAELRGMYIPDLCSETQARLATHLEHLEHTSFDRGEWPLRHKDGHTLQVELTTQRLADGRYLAVGRDVSAIREMQAALREAQAIAHIASWVLDIPSGRLRWSPQMYRMLHIDEGCGLGWDEFLAYVHDDDRAMVVSAWQAALAGADYELDHRILVDGELRWVRQRAEVEFAPPPSGRALRAAGTVQDITMHKDAELELIRYRYHLEALIGERTAELENANRRLRGSEVRTRALLELNTAGGSEKMLSEHALAGAERLTGSAVAYLHLVDEDQQGLTLYAWSQRTQRACRLEGRQHFPISRAGVWADSLRRRVPVVHNEFTGLPSRRDMPVGHVALQRHLSVPVLADGRVVLLLGVGNKPVAYDDIDVQELQAFANEMWRILLRRRGEQAGRSKDQQQAEFAAGLRAALRDLQMEVEAVRQVARDEDHTIRLDRVDAVTRRLQMIIDTNADRGDRPS